MLIEDPSGRRWSVRRRWLGLRRPRWRGPEDPGLDALDVGDDPSGVLAVLALIAVVILVALFAVPLVVFGVELVIVLAAAGLGLAGRLLLGRPWTLEARSDDGRLVWREVAGWRDSREALDAMREDIAAGRPTRTERTPVPVPPPNRRALEAALACVLALLWLGGAGSLAAIAVAAAVRHAPETGPWGRRLAVVAVVLAAAGLVLTALVVLGVISEHHRVA